MKKEYYYLPTDSYGQPTGLVQPVMLTEEEFEQLLRERFWVFEDYSTALLRAMD